MQKNYVQKDLDEETEGYQHAFETETEEIKARWDAEWSSSSDHWAGLRIQKRGRSDGNRFSHRLAGRVDGVQRNSSRARSSVHGW